MKTIDLPIRGMHCAGCVSTVERSLAEAPGVREVNVNLANERATVQLVDDAFDLSLLIQRIEKTGYGVIFEELKFPFTPNGSSQTELDQIKAEKPEILDISVDPQNQLVTVTALPDRVNGEWLRRQLTEVGFDLIPLKQAAATSEPTEQQAREEIIGKQGRLVRMGVVLTVPLIVLSMLLHFIAIELSSQQRLAQHLLFFLLATPVQVMLGREYLRGAVTSLRNRSANMDVLVAMGSYVAYLFSVCVSLGLWFGFSDWLGHREYYETAAAILTLITLGKYLEAHARGQTSAVVQRLMKRSPQTAWLLADEELIEVPVSSVQAGDDVVVPPGTIIPVDGTILEGATTIDQSTFTGESHPQEASAGDEVIGGTINQYGRITIRAAKVGQESAFAQLIRLVEQAQGSKPPIQHMADRIAKVFVPLVLALALLTFVYWISAAASLNTAIIHAIAVLVIACPCALGLATPTATIVGIGLGAENGVLFRNSASLEMGSKIKAIVFDKTGTITHGRPEVTTTHPLKNASAERLLFLAASASTANEHPLAQAIVREAKHRGIQIAQPSDVQLQSGMGIQARVAEHQVLLGNETFMQENEIDCRDLAKGLAELQEQGASWVIIAVDGRAAGVFGVADTIRDSAMATIRHFNQHGIETILLSGDNETASQSIGNRVGVKRIIANVLPAEKTTVIQELQQSGQQVAMVGDGINDAPALVQANWGIAMSSGSDIAVEAADVTIMSGDLNQVVKALAISKLTLKTIQQNLFWAFIYNVILIPVAMMGWLQPIFAAAAMAASSLFVVGNSLRIRHSRRWARP